MIRAARRVILLTDSSKLGRTGFIKVAPLTARQTMIGDGVIPAATREAIGAMGIELVVV